MDTQTCSYACNRGESNWWEICLNMREQSAPRKLRGIQLMNIAKFICLHNAKNGCLAASGFFEQQLKSIDNLPFF